MTSTRALLLTTLILSSLSKVFGVSLLLTALSTGMAQAQSVNVTGSDNTCTGLNEIGVSVSVDPVGSTGGLMGAGGG